MESKRLRIAPSCHSQSSIFYPLSSILILCLPLWCFSASHPNVLLISIDTLRADHLGCYGYSVTTPAIDALAKKAVLFEQAVSQVPLTLPSHSTIFTGLYPDQHGVRNNENFVLPDKLTTLAELFRNNGYSTAGVAGSFSLDSSFGINQGFQFYEDQIGDSHDPAVSRYVERRAETVWKIGRKWSESQKGPWFLFLHFFDPHTGYNPPQPYPQNYDGEIAYADSVIEQITRFIDNNTTIIVLLSDHGESLGEHGELSHGVFLYDATLRVPLLILAPGFQPNRIKHQVRLVDVAPTLAELAGLKNLPPFSGKTLLPLIKGSAEELPAYSETYYTNLLMGWAPLHSLRWKNKKWIDAPKAEFYDLMRDPTEVKNVYSESLVPREFRQEMQRRVASTPTLAPQREVDPELQEKLAALGYVTGSSPTPVVSKFDPKDGIAIWARIENAVTAAQTSDLEKSKALFLGILEDQPDNVIAHKFLAAVLRKKGDHQEAIAHLKTALQSPLHRTETAYELALAHYDLMQYDNALSQLSQVLQNEPSHAHALKLAAFSAMHAKKYPEASQYFERALKERPNEVECLANYARVLSYLQRDLPALQTYERLSAIRPLTDEEAVQVAAIHLTSKNLQGAEKYFRLALQVNSKSITAWKGLALILATKQQWLEAMNAFLEAGDCSNARKMMEKAVGQGEPGEKFLEVERKCP